jgi:hypothetical protein
MGYANLGPRSFSSPRSNPFQADNPICYRPLEPIRLAQIEDEDAHETHCLPQHTASDVKDVEIARAERIPARVASVTVDDRYPEPLSSPKTAPCPLINAPAPKDVKVPAVEGAGSLGSRPSQATSD